MVLSTSGFKQLYCEESFRYSSDSIIQPLMGKNPFKKQYLEDEMMTPLVVQIDRAEQALMYSKMRIVGLNCVMQSIKSETEFKTLKHGASLSEKTSRIFGSSCIFTIFEKMVKPLYASNFDFNLMAGHLQIIKSVLDLQVVVLELISQQTFEVFQRRSESQALGAAEKSLLLYLYLECQSLTAF